MSNVLRKDFFSFLGFLEKEGYIIISEKNSMYVEIENPKPNLETYEGKLSSKANAYILSDRLKLDFEFGEAFEISKNKFRIPLFIKSEKVGWGHVRDDD